MDLEALADKYRILVIMRREREAFEAQGIRRLEGAAQKERHTRARALATRFPGALRELDSLDAAQLAKRLAEVEEELAHGRPRRIWVRVMLDFHAELRQALHVKRWLRGHPGPHRIADLRQHLTRCHVVPRGLDARALRRYASPPEGRMLELVFERLGRRHRRDPADLKRLVFPE